MAKYTVFESTNMASTKYAERIMDAVCENDIENGTFGYLDGLVEGESVIYNFVPGFKEGKKVVVVDHPAWDYDESRRKNQRKDKFINEAYTPFRVRVLKELDEFGITIEGITIESRKMVMDVSDFMDTPIYLTINTNGKLTASDTKTNNAIFQAQIMRKRLTGAIISTPIRNYGYSSTIYESQIIHLT